MKRTSQILSVILAAVLASTNLASAGYSTPPDPKELLSGDRTNDAVAYLKARTQSAPDDAEAFNLLSRAYYELEQWDLSIAAAQRAIALKPDSSAYHLWLGRAYGNKAEHSSWFTALTLAKRTRSEFEKAVQLDENNVNARSDLAEYYMEAPGFLGGGTDKARAQADRLAEHDAAGSCWVKARLAEKSGDLAEAEREYQEAIKASTDPGGEWLNLAGFYRHQKRFKEMQDAIDHAVSYEKRKSNVLFDAAEMLFRAGRNFPAAAQLVRKYISSKQHEETAPTFQAHYLLGQILEKQGEKKAAAEEYQAALSEASDFRQAQEALRRVTRE
ncbi:MAG TPA: tetratricopeptide repeat protein [Terriglobales bacterium]|nr:tetratricopeptide repeat protein [Terriglobales bacterium]